MGDGALDYVLVMGSFHFVNRIADLLHVDPEALPERLRRFEWVRRLGVRAASRLIARMDLAVRPYDVTYEQAVDGISSAVTHATRRPLRDELMPLASRPKLIEVLRLALEERDVRSLLSRETLARVHRLVEAALPAGAEDVEGVHPRPADPVEAFVFVGTRYAHRATQDMVGALRAARYGDLGILDLAIAIADANQWARTYRLLGLAPGLFYVGARDG